MKYGSYPLLGIAGAFALGIVASQFTIFTCSLALLSGIPVSCLLFILGRKRNGGWMGRAFVPALLLGVTGLGMVSGHFALVRPGNAIENWIGEEQELEVVALEDARSCRGGLKVQVDCRGLVSGKLMLYVPDSASEIQAHDRLAVSARIRPLSSRNPGYAAYLRNQGVYATAQATRIERKGQEAHLLLPLADLRRDLAFRIRKTMPDEQMAGLAVAMLLGDRSGLDRELREDFSRAGLAHILAISGLHVGLVFLFLGSLLQFLAVTPAGARLRTLLVVALLVAYMLLTGASPAVCRAVLMLSMLEMGKLVFRRRNSLNLLAASALLQLLISPALVFNIGFQLSYAAVAGILTCAPILEKQLKKAFPKLGRKLAGAAAVCLAAQLMTAPLVGWHFQQFPTYFLLSNLALLPLVSVAVRVGISGLLLAWVPVLNTAIFGVLDFLLASIAWLSGQISNLPGAVVENLSLTDPACLICMAMVLLILGALYHREIRSWAGSARRTSYPRLAEMGKLQISWHRAAGLTSLAGLLLGMLAAS